MQYTLVERSKPPAGITTTVYLYSLKMQAFFNFFRMGH